ncbi:unnamed protein product [Camellia sinensis]
MKQIATSLFANSPFTEGKPNGYLSKRSFEEYVDYALDVTMYFVCQKKKYIDCTGMCFQDFMSGKLAPIPGELPTLNDWENHLTTIFPERYLEMRGADGGPWRSVGLLYDEVSLQNVLDMITDWTPKERQMLRNKWSKDTISRWRHVAEDHGLERRGFKETGFLNEVAEVYRTGVTPAEKLLEMYHGKWGQSVDPVFEELLY